MRIAATTVLVISSLSAGEAQNLGSPPPEILTPVDVYSAFRLPPAKDASEPLDRTKLPLQVVRRAVALRLTAASASESWRTVTAFMRTPHTFAPGTERQVAVHSAAELNRILADPAFTRVKVTSADLLLEVPVEINRSGVTLDLTGVNVTGAPSSPWMIRIRNAAGVTVVGGRFTGGASGILVDRSGNVAILDAVFQNLGGVGVAVTDSSGTRIARNRFSGLCLAAVILHRAATRSIVESNIIQDNLGTSNMTAGILLTDREVDITSTLALLLGPDGYWPAEQPITERLRPPHDNAVVWNTVSTNHSSGIYSDGSVRNLIAGNTIRGNAKEGLCLDNGSTANVVYGNTITQNGQRWGQSDEALDREFIRTWGRLQDGTAAAKVPGISIDNAIYNVVIGNNVSRNFGGGIKMVRTSYFNAIGMNSLLSNNEGEGAVFHFFGIELGGAAADGSSHELDFTPSRGNVIFSNMIRGTHYSGIFLAPGSDFNDIFDNTIMDATHWSLESAQVMNNATLNNLTNIESVNVSPGLSPAGLK